MTKLILLISVLSSCAVFAQIRGGGHPNPDNREDSELLFEYHTKKENLMSDLKKRSKECFSNSYEITSILALRINISVLQLKTSKRCPNPDLISNIEQEKEKWKCLLPSADNRRDFHDFIGMPLFRKELGREQLSEEEIKNQMDYFKTYIP